MFFVYQLKINYPMKKRIIMIILAFSLLVCCLDGCKSQKKIPKKGGPIPCPLKDC